MSLTFWSKHVSGISYSTSVFESIDALVDILLPLSVSYWTAEASQKKATEIEIRLRTLHKGTLPDNGHFARGSKSKTTTIDELYLMSALIYLNRTVMQYSGEEVQHRTLVQQALSHLSQIWTSQALWPLFIIGCEARTDSERTRVLQMTSSMGDGGLSDNALWMRRLIEAYWNQEDLDAEDNLSYVQKMSGVISACPFLPAFV